MPKNVHKESDRVIYNFFKRLKLADTQVVVVLLTSSKSALNVSITATGNISYYLSSPELRR